MRCLVTGLTASSAERSWPRFKARALPSSACDFNRDVEVSLWVPRLKDIDAVVNCVGVLQGSLRDAADRSHTDATIALFEACAAVSVRRIVHVSAVSAEAVVATDYARSKAKADAALGKLDANWLIVKPSLMPESFASASSLVSGAGFDAAFARALVGVASIAGIFAGALFLLPRWVRRAGVAQLILSTVYLVGLSVLALSYGPTISGLCSRWCR
jgi:putative NAD(P)-binding protein